MTDYKGVIDFDYFGRRITFEYKMNNLGGSPHIYFRDKHGKYHTFFYRKFNQSWELSGNYHLKWPADFITVLFAAFDIEREKHGL